MKADGRSCFDFDVRNRDVFVLGSAPDSIPPLGGGRDWAIFTVNGSQAVLERMGLPLRPMVTLMNTSLIKTSEKANAAARKVLRHRATEHLVMLTTKEAERRRWLAALRLRLMGYRYASLTMLATRHRQEIMEDVLRQPYAQEHRPSNGLFLALLALHLGASRVLMSGFSLSKGGHAYNSLNLHRGHLSGDTFALQRIVELGLPVFTNDERFGAESGLRLLP